MPKTSHNTPSSNGATPSRASTATRRITPPTIVDNWPKIDELWHYRHSRRRGRRRPMDVSPGAHRPCSSARPGGTTVMALVVLSFLLLLVLASVAGWTADARDSADWKPSEAFRLDQ